MGESLLWHGFDTLWESYLCGNNIQSLVCCILYWPCLDKILFFISHPLHAGLRAHWPSLNVQQLGCRQPKLRTQWKCIIPVCSIQYLGHCTAWHCCKWAKYPSAKPIEKSVGLWLPDLQDPDGAETETTERWRYLASLLFDIIAGPTEAKQQELESPQTDSKSHKPLCLFFCALCQSPWAPLSPHNNLEPARKAMPE